MTKRWLTRYWEGHRDGVQDERERMKERFADAYRAGKVEELRLMAQNLDNHGLTEAADYVRERAAAIRAEPEEE